MTTSIESPGREPASFTPAYETKNVYAGGNSGRKPSATIYFDGLLCLCFDGNKECTVGVNTHKPSHVLNFGIWRKSDCRQIEIAIPEGRQEIEINVINPVDDGVYVYDPALGTPPIEHRDSYVEYCLDMEGPKVHGKPLEKNPDALWPRFRINNGLFCAYKTSLSQFRFERGGIRVRDLGPIALALAADIFLSPGGSIEFLMDGSSILARPLTDGDEYEIAITNLCTGRGCGADPADAGILPSIGNDFHLYYDAVVVPPGEQLDLVNIAPAGSSGPTPLGRCISEGPRGPFGEHTPCMSVTLGQTARL
jgi:hypothetical protein